MRLVALATMLCVRDLDRSVAFYRHKLGFELLESEPHVALLRRDGGVVYLFTESGPTDDKPLVQLVPPEDPRRGSVVLVLVVEDCRAAYDALRAHGVEFLTPPRQPPWGGWRCFAHDPDGYLIEVDDAAAELLA